MCLCTCSVHCTRTLLHIVFVYMNMYVVYTCIYMHVPTHMHAHTCTHTHTHTTLMQAGLLESVVSSEFVSLVRLIERFVHDCTEVTGRQCPTLRSSLLSQVSMYMDMYMCTVHSLYMCMCMYIHVRIYMYMQLYIMSQKPQHIYPTLPYCYPGPTLTYPTFTSNLHSVHGNF